MGNSTRNLAPRIKTRSTNANTHPGLVDDIDSDGEPPTSPPRPKPKRKRAPKLSAEEEEAKVEQRKVSIRKISNLEKDMAAKAGTDLNTPKASSARSLPQREHSYVIPEPSSELTQLPNESETLDDDDESDIQVAPKSKKRKTQKAAVGIRKAIAIQQASGQDISDHDFVSSMFG